MEIQPESWRPALKKHRFRCQRELIGYVEGMDYGMPSYSRDGTTEVALASQARHLSLYILKKPVLDAHRSSLSGLSVGNGAIRYRRPDQIDWTVVDRLLADTAGSTDGGVLIPWSGPSDGSLANQGWGEMHSVPSRRWAREDEVCVGRGVAGRWGNAMQQLGRC